MRYTAANNCLLTVIKRTYNAKIYKEALRLYNESTRQSVFDYINTFHCVDVQSRLEDEAHKEACRRSEERARSFRHLIR